MNNFELDKETLQDSLADVLQALAKNGFDEEAAEAKELLEELNEIDSADAGKKTGLWQRIKELCDRLASDGRYKIATEIPKLAAAILKIVGAFGSVAPAVMLPLYFCIFTIP